MPRLAQALVVLAALALLVAAAAWLGQRRLLYFPDREDLVAATRRARALGLEPWTDGGELLGWRAPPVPGARAVARVVFLHGNAGSALDRVGAFETLRAGAAGGAVEVFLAEYPGYGPRPGAPTEDALLASALRALEVARRDAPGAVLLGGESLGSAVAALAAARAPERVDGLLLVTPLASVPAVARRHYGPVAGWLVRDTWRADRALAGYGGPVAFVVAGRDEITFTDLGRALHAAYAGPKWLWVDPAATHNAIDWRPSNPRWRDAFAFLLSPAS
jgi:pimeloyl-ACP methyl ester carboxylesterase